ncbi:Uracil phosphoribosyltransferase [Corynebacterium sphenisci DSM 44792]|uniref:Bifunctional protein PyrR n=1 Tax=Corynebacterium sphenisci DSM 44792 TaxID=1437874 RepID=A0A1L7CXW0_9CORY|nr:bifunctional pyr operon transcriptional regulator/uracil phosphoribosyltransferase PyrR [Corynebacterium sphenisci]APT90706.1 Uracil phosphoribosyltransferase [Corynebacterium sphenisci DSM 44792]
MSDGTPDGTRATAKLLDAEEVSRTVARIAHQIIEKTALDGSAAPTVVLLGIPSGGVPLAERLAGDIERFSGIRPATGSLDITLYRDDLRDRPHRALQPTRIPDGGVDGAIVILVDDVLFSGRTIRAALDAIGDIGRPAAIQLAVLVDRGHRELPIRADYVGKNLPTSRSEDVRVLARAIDGRDAVLLTRGAGS